MRKFRLLSASDDLPLLATRNEILTRAGYEVIAACTDEVLSLAGNADGVLLGYSVPLEKRASLAVQLRHRFPDIPVIVIHHTNEEAGAEFATASFIVWTVRKPSLTCWSRHSRCSRRLDSRSQYPYEAGQGYLSITEAVDQPSISGRRLNPWIEGTMPITE